MKDSVPSYADVENIKREVNESLSILKIVGQLSMLLGSRLRKQQHQL